MFKIILIITFIVATILGIMVYNMFSPKEKFIVYYSDQKTPEALFPYDVIVLDSDYHPPLKKLLNKQKIILGYISLGELESERSFFKALQQAEPDLVLHENINWPGSYFIDVRKQAWHTYIIQKYIPRIIKKGFTGIMLDTVDYPAELERQHPNRYQGMKEATMRLIKTIRKTYPDITIMMNRGYALLPEIAKDINMILGESSYTYYNFTTQSAEILAEETYQTYLDLLRKAQEANPELKIYTLDYWDKNDQEGIKHIYKTQRDNGFIPYVTTISLHEITPEPE